MKRKKYFFQVILFTFVISMSGCGSSTKKQKVYHIGITQLMTNPGIDAIREGFLDEMSKLGYKDNVNIKYTQENSQGDNIVAQSIAKKFVNDSCDMIFAITTPTAQVCAQEIKGTNIPLVFGAVTDPVSAKLVNSLEKPGGNITGTSDKWPTNAQFDLLLQLIPSVKRIGVVYNPGETNSEYNIKEVKKVCSLKKLELIKVAVSNTSEVFAAAQSLVGKIDAFYVSADNTVITAMDAVIKVSEKNKIPLLPGVSSNVEQGGFGTLGPNYFDVGVEAAKIADKIIKGEKPANIPVSSAKKFDYFFNLKSAKTTGVVIPNDLLQKATKVYK
jgi:putative tryptophan/tyrosine transport system substrate-binding protein